MRLVEGQINSQAVASLPLLFAANRHYWRWCFNACHLRTWTHTLHPIGRRPPSYPWKDLRLPEGRRRTASLLLSWRTSVSCQNPSPSYFHFYSPDFSLNIKSFHGSILTTSLHKSIPPLKKEEEPVAGRLLVEIRQGFSIVQKRPGILPGAMSYIGREKAQNTVKKRKAHFFL